MSTQRPDGDVESEPEPVEPEPVELVEPEPDWDVSVEPDDVLEPEPEPVLDVGVVDEGSVVFVTVPVVFEVVSLTVPVTCCSAVGFEFESAAV